jgi:hypothetical protein
MQGRTFVRRFRLGKLIQIERVTLTARPNISSTIDVVNTGTISTQTRKFRACGMRISGRIYLRIERSEGFFDSAMHSRIEENLLNGSGERLCRPS